MLNKFLMCITFIFATGTAMANDQDADNCIVGDAKCGPKGLVLKCEHNYKGQSWWRETVDKCKQENRETRERITDSCIVGDSKCGPEGKIMKCEHTYQGQSIWRGTVDRCDR